MGRSSKMPMPRSLKADRTSTASPDRSSVTRPLSVLMTGPPPVSARSTCAWARRLASSQNFRELLGLQDSQDGVVDELFAAPTPTVLRGKRPATGARRLRVSPRRRCRTGPSTAVWQSLLGSPHCARAARPSGRSGRCRAIRCASTPPRPTAARGCSSGRAGPTQGCVATPGRSRARRILTRRRPRRLHPIRVISRTRR